MANKQLKKLSEQYQMNYEKKYNVVYGSIHGYHTTILEQNATEYYISIGVDMNENEAEQVKIFLNDFTKKKKYIKKLECKSNTIICIIRINYAKAIETIKLVLDEMINHLTNRNINSCCHHCNSKEMLAPYISYGEASYLCPSCSSKVEQQKLNVASEKKGNTVAGILGATIGALLGGILMVLILQTGYIAGIAGLIMIMLSIKGYQLLGGKIDKVGIIVSLVVCFVTIFIAEHVGICVTMYSELKKIAPTMKFTDMNYIELLTAAWEDSEISLAIVHDLVLSYILSIGCGYYYIKQEFRKSRLQDIFIKL